MTSQYRIIKFITFVTFLCVIGFPSAYVLFDIKKQSITQHATQSFIKDVKFAQKSAINNNNAISISAIEGDWNNGWNISSKQTGLIKTSTFDPNLRFNNSQIKKILFQPSGITHVLQPLGDAGFLICDQEGRGNRLTMIASGYIHVKDIKQNCLT